MRLAAFLIALLSASAASAAQAPAVPPGDEVATFAGGCFWCMESDFDKVPGVVATISGYTGGFVANPGYEQVSSGTTGHAESVEVIFDPKKVSYQKLLDYYWVHVDPTTKDRQFCDVGNQYRTAIFWHDEAQRQAAEESKRRIEATKPFKAPIVTEIVKAGPVKSQCEATRLAVMFPIRLAYRLSSAGGLRILFSASSTRARCSGQLPCHS